MWALEGLRQLIQNNYHFTIRERTKANMETAIKEGNNIVEFMESEGYFLFSADSQITSPDFYAIYELWCDDNTTKSVTSKSFSTYRTFRHLLFLFCKGFNKHIAIARKICYDDSSICRRCPGWIGKHLPHRRIFNSMNSWDLACLCIWGFTLS